MHRLGNLAEVVGIRWKQTTVGADIAEALSIEAGIEHLVAQRMGVAEGKAVGKLRLVVHKVLMKMIHNPHLEKRHTVFVGEGKVTHSRKELWLVGGPLRRKEDCSHKYPDFVPLDYFVSQAEYSHRCSHQLPAPLFEPYVPPISFLSLPGIQISVSLAARLGLCLRHAGFTLCLLYLVALSCRLFAPECA